MAEKVGSIFYTVTLDTAEMVAGQRRVDASLKSSSSSIDSFGGKLRQITSAVQAYAAATFLISNTDAYTKLNAQLKLATDGHSSLAVAQEKVRSISREAQTDINSIAVLYARITNATKELRTSQFAVGEITRVVALSLKVSGASAAEASSAMLQLSQSFASGVMRGEEFNSVSEAAPRLMKALADGIGVPIGRLRAMAEAGKLTTSVLVEALPKALGALEQEAKQVQTISGAFQVLKNEVMLFVGAQTTANGTASAAASALTTLAQNLDLVAAAAVGLATAKGASVFLAYSVATVASTKATLDDIAAQRASAAAAILTAEAKVVETAATVASAESELAASGAKIAGLQTTQAAIVAARAEAVAKLQSAQAATAQAQAQIAAATAAGAQSYALAMLRTGTLKLAAAQALQAKQTRELAILGQQQAAVAAQVTAATAAQTAASRGLIAANAAQATAQMGVASAVTATSGAMTIARSLLAALGGPIGIITTLLGLGAVAWMLWGNSAQTAGDQAAQALAKAQQDHSGYAQAVSRLDSVIEKERAKGAMADEARIKRLQGLRARAAADEKSAWNEIAGMKSQKAGQETLERNYTTRYESPEVIKARQKDRLKVFMEGNQTDMEKYRAEAAKVRAELGDMFTPDVDKRLRKKHHLDKNDPNAGKSDEAKKYYEGLVAENSFALARIDAEEREALAENAKRAAKDKGNIETYAKAKLEIHKKFARERAQLEDKTASEIADLNIAITTDEATRIELVRVEAVRKADAAEKLGTTTHEQAERARALATFNAAQSTADLVERNAVARAEKKLSLTKDEESKITQVRDEATRVAEEAYKRGKITFEEMEAKKVAAVQNSAAQQKALEAARASTRGDTLQLRASTSGGVGDEVAVIQAEAAAKLAANQAAWDADRGAAEIYADQRAAIEENMYRRIADARDSANQAALASTSDAFGSIANVLKKSDGEQSGIYKAMFAAQKAFSIASSIVAIQTGIAKASELAFPANLAAMASVAAATASIISTISGTNYGGGRAEGGPVVGGSMYRVGEKGPEIFQGANGQNFMIPGQAGRVASNDQIGSSGMNLTIVNKTTGRIDNARYENTAQGPTLTIEEIAGQLDDPNSTLSKAHRRNFRSERVRS